MNVSVVMATYNGARFVDAQIGSILAQLEKHDELVVVDDASTDDTPERVAAIADGRVALHRNGRNRGVLATFEQALRLARHEVIFLADQDDLWFPEKRVTLHGALEENPFATLAISDAQVIDETGAVIAPSFMAMRDGFRGSLLATLVKN